MSKKTYDLRWNNNKHMISEKCEIYLKPFLEQIEGYDNLTKKDIKNIRRKVKIKINDKQLNSLRRNVLFQKIISNGNRAKILQGKLKHYYNVGMSIKELSKKYDLSPMTIANKIFKKKYVKNKRAKKELKYAQKHDALMGNPQEIKDKSQNFEVDIIDHFIELDIPLMTEEELKKQQREKYGREISTPDIVFDKPIYINDQSVKWLDCKNYYGSILNEFLIKKNQQQVDKYNAKWGPGALLFSLGFNRNLDKKLKNVILLDWINGVKSVN